jgi:hypothetical protein
MTALRALLPVVATVAVASVLLGGLGVFHARSSSHLPDGELSKGCSFEVGD